VDIECDHGNTVLIPLGTALRTPFIDPTALPKQPQVWKYRIQYRKGDLSVGNWSSVMEITVKEQS
jgi:hypothetical protein